MQLKLLTMCCWLRAALTHWPFVHWRRVLAAHTHTYTHTAALLLLLLPPAICGHSACQPLHWVHFIPHYLIYLFWWWTAAWSLTALHSRGNKICDRLVFFCSVFSRRGSTGSINPTTGTWIDCGLRRWQLKATPGSLDRCSVQVTSVAVFQTVVCGIKFKLIHIHSQPFTDAFQQ